MNPAKLNSYVVAYNKRMETEDVQAWRNGIYNMSAVMCAVDRCLNGKKAVTEYIEKPLLSESSVKKQPEEEKELTEEEKKAERENLLMRLKIMMSNFNTS